MSGKDRFSDTCKLSEEQKEECRQGKSVTTRELAARLHFAPRTILRLCEEGVIAAWKPLGKHWRIPQSEADRLASQGIKRPPAKLPTEPEVLKIVVDPRLAPQLQKGSAMPAPTQREGIRIGLPFLKF